MKDVRYLVVLIAFGLAAVPVLAFQSGTAERPAAAPERGVFAEMADAGPAIFVPLHSRSRFVMRPTGGVPVAQ